MSTYKYNYHCKEDHCPDLVRTIIIEKDEEFADEPEFCEGCSKPLYQVGIMNAYRINTFGGKSSSEKQAILKKRSQEHYKKEIEPVKRHMNNNIL